VADALVLFFTIVAGVAAALALLAGAYRLARRKLGRKWDHYRRLQRLGPETQVSFFTSILGASPAVRRKVQRKVTSFVEEGEQFREVEQRRDYWECIWIDPDWYVQAVSNTEDETILAFSITTRSSSFTPRFHSPAGWFERRSRVIRGWALGKFTREFDLRLGRTTFAEAIDHPGEVKAYVGAHNWGYTEIHWGANPGLYQHFVLSVNDAGAHAWGEEVQLLFPEGPGGDFTWNGEPPYEDMPSLVAFRKAAKINTFSIIGPSLLPSDYPVTFGPHENLVRVIP
jgi:hypothetical protein